MSARTDSDIIGDGHVHLHSCYRWRDFFEVAFRNLADIGADGSLSERQRLCLVFTESADERVFDQLAALAHSPAMRANHKELSPWRVEPTAEDLSVVLTDGERSIAVVAGSQVAARERLEVLVVGSRLRIPDGLPIREVLDRTAEAGVVRVIPWGAGKWLSARGRLLESLIRNHGGPSLFLGDEAGRPTFWPRPHLYERAAELGVRDLPGSDPLPFASEVHKVGRMGFRVSAAWDPQAPAASLLGALLDPQSEITRFARLEPVHRFIVNQFRMQLRKRLRRLQRVATG